jgi:copper chaperone CopZ
MGGRCILVSVGHWNVQNNFELRIKNMKRLVIFLLAIMPMAFCLSTAQAKPNKQKVVLYVDLHCQDCCNKILKNIPFDKDLKSGVKDLVFDLEAKTVTVTYDANKTDVPAIQKAFAKIGKPATTEAPKCHHHCEGHHHHAEGEHHHH